ncbi:MAG TPA: hypothetical protein VL481_01960 [Verrucomicrobiae bacterium]|nr:hypothetical protein [Verrucomicrobiae bacterium]
MLGVIAGVVGAIGYAPYIRDILKGTTKPDRASWLIWLLEYAALFCAQLSVGTAGSLWLIGLQLLAVIAINILSYRYGTGGFTKENSLVLLSVCAVLTAWYFIRSADLTIILLIAVEASGVILTMRKVYKQPGSETLIMWALIALAGMIGVIAIGKNASLILYAYPVALIVMGLGVMGASWLGSKRTNNPSYGATITE